MKALSLWQPWATLVVIGAKKIETRSWKTSHRGRLAVHAARTFPPELRDLCRHEPFKSALARAGFPGPAALPLGCLLGCVSLEDCCPTHELENDLSAIERAFGDYRPDRWGWLLTDPSCLVTPIPYTGARGLFDVDDALCVCDQTVEGCDSEPLKPTEKPS